MLQMPKPSYCVRSRLNVHQGHSDSSWKKRRAFWQFLEEKDRNPNDLYFPG